MISHPEAKAPKTHDHTLLFAGGSTVLLIVIGWAIRSEPAGTPPAPTAVSSAVHEQLPMKRPEVVMNEWN